MNEQQQDIIPVSIQFTPEQKDILSNTAIWAKTFFKAVKPDHLVMGGHGFDHNQRVSGMAAYIAVHENYDPFLPVLSALVLDVGRTSSDSRAHTPQHGKLSAEMVEPYLKTIDLLSYEERQLTLQAIEDHPLLNHQVRQTELVKILMDADRLDGIGAIGPVRAGATRWRYPVFTGTEGSSPHETALISIYQDFGVRLPKWYESIWTETARRLAKPRLEFLLAFNDRFYKEVNFMLDNYRNLGLE